MNFRLYKHPEENIFQYIIRYFKNVKMQITRMKNDKKQRTAYRLG